MSTVIYVSHDANGNINGVYADQQLDTPTVALADNDPSVVAYLAPPIPEISDRQFFQQLAVQGIISQQDALLANAAVIPAPLLTLIEAMPAGQQFAAKMIVSGSVIFHRNHPLSIAIGTAYGMSSAQIDAFFKAAALL
jgi:hypothetical protein